jgi:hypothetical protein
MDCKRCKRIMGAIEWILSAAIGRHCTSCGVELGLFREEG